MKTATINLSIRLVFAASVIFVILMAWNLYAIADVVDRPTGNINFIVGTKLMNENDWEPLDEQTEIGVEGDIGMTDFPLYFTMGYLYSHDDTTLYGVVIDASTKEFYFGPKLIFNPNKYVHPFVGAGLAIISTELEGSGYGITVSDEDQATGLWASGGIMFTIADHLNLGVNVRYSKAEAELYGYDTSGGGLHYQALIGYHF